MSTDVQTPFLGTPLLPLKTADRPRQAAREPGDTSPGRRAAHLPKCRLWRACAEEVADEIGTPDPNPKHVRSKLVFLIRFVFLTFV